jgi:hypothetical protein
MRPVLRKAPNVTRRPGHALSVNIVTARHHDVGPSAHRGTWISNDGFGLFTAHEYRTR